MKFGIFEHLDSNGASLEQQFRSRLEFIEIYDRAGFYCYHLAEHHNSPLSLVPSPGLFLAAVAQRTRQLRFGPLVYLLPFYHPLRLIEEICMLDHLSGGRFQLGVGKGISPIEMNYYGVDPATAQQRYIEALEVIRRGLTSDVLNFEGEFYKFSNVPMSMKPVQRPHPPLWYGIGSADSTVWAAANNVNVVTLMAAPVARGITERYRREWATLGREPEAMPLLGIGRQIVVADTDREANDIARRAYRRWRRNFGYLWEQHNKREFADRAAPAQFEDARDRGLACAGSPASVRDFIAREVRESGANYLVAFLTFGDISVSEARKSIELFGDEVMPAFDGP